MAELADALANQVAQLSLRGYGTAEVPAPPATVAGATPQQWQAPGTPAESVVAGMDAALQSLRELIGGAACTALGIDLGCSVLPKWEQLDVKAVMVALPIWPSAPFQLPHESCRHQPIS